MLSFTAEGMWWRALLQEADPVEHSFELHVELQALKVRFAEKNCLVLLIGA